MFGIWLKPEVRRFKLKRVPRGGVRCTRGGRPQVCREKRGFLATPGCKKDTKRISTYGEVDGRGLISVRGLARLRGTRKQRGFFILCLENPGMG